MKNQSTINDSNPGLHAEPGTLRQQQSHADEPTMFHYANTRDLKAGIPTNAVCGVQIRPGSDCAIGATGVNSWIMCPICEFIYSLRGDEQRLRQWITGTCQLEKNQKEHAHE
jgi:hypothetical protein